jgi:adenylate cyclase
LFTASKGHYENAKEYFTRSLNLARELDDERGVASALNNLGLIHKETSDFKKAFEFYMLSLEITEKLGDKRDVAATHNNIGQIYALQGLFHKAIESFEHSISIKETIGDRNGIALSLNAIGSIMEQRGEHHSAIEWCLKGLTVAEEIGALHEQKTACECLYSNYKAIKHGEKALFYHERLALLNDSLSAAEISKAIQQLEFSKLVLADSIARADEKEKIKQAHATEVRRKNQSRNIFIAATLILLIGAISLYNRVRYIRKSRAELAKEKNRSDNLLLNILPADIARELKEKGEATARKFDNISILFTDFKDFTALASKHSPEEIVSELNTCFVEFDAICERYGVEKIKTVGDSYMVAGGLPVPTPGCVKSTVMAALEMMQFMKERKKTQELQG